MGRAGAARVLTLTLILIGWYRWKVPALLGYEVLRRFLVVQNVVVPFIWIGCLTGVVVNSNPNPTPNPNPNSNPDPPRGWYPPLTPESPPSRSTQPASTSLYQSLASKAHSPSLRSPWR